MLALLLVLPPLLVQSPAPATQAEIDSAIDEGVAYLLSHYQEDARRAQVGFDPARAEWGRPNGDGIHALILYTLLKCGIARDHDVVRKILGRLSFADIDRTYNGACLLLALEEHDPIEHREWIEEIAERLISWQDEGGSWAYPAGKKDLSNTQYAALGLWAAARAGVDVPAEVWSKMARAAMRHQSSNGGFSYRLPVGRVTGSMTGAGSGTLALCEIHLRLAGAFDGELALDVARSRDEGVAWLTKHFTVETNPKLGQYLYYYLYGIERVGALCGIERFGEHAWYTEGAREIVERQGSDGAWPQLYDPAQTCFALLFLARATAQENRVPKTGGGQRPEGVDPLAQVELTVRGDAPLALSIARFGNAELKRLTWPGEHGRGLHVVRVEYFAGNELVAVILGDPTRPAGSSTLPAKVWIREAGEQVLGARVMVLGPPRLNDDGDQASGEISVLESNEVKTTVERVVPDWLVAGDACPSLELAKVRAKAESVWRGDARLEGLRFGAANAMDGNPRTPWLADANAKKRTLRLNFGSSEEIDCITIRPGMLAGFDHDWIGRPIEIELKLNGRKRHALAMPPDPRQSVRLELEESMTLKRLEITILSATVGSVFDAVGIGEVELALR